MLNSLGLLFHLSAGEQKRALVFTYLLYIHQLNPNVISPEGVELHPIHFKA